MNAYSDRTNKPLEHDKIIKEVYEEIYPDHYKFNPHELAHTKAMLLKNLDELDISAASITSKTVLNVGTGIESIAFHNLGFKAVYHFDISDVSVNNLQKLKIENPQYSNLYSNQADMCGDNVNIPSIIDVVYLVGVLHHFYSPLNGIKNLLPKVRIGGRMFFRIYRSGNPRAFVADYCRKFIDESCRCIFKDVFCSRFGKFPYGNGSWAHNLPAHLYQIIFDDLFVPTLLLFHPRQVEAFFETNGCSILKKLPFVEYDHENNSPGNGLISLLIKKDREIDEIQGNFPPHIDQLMDIHYKEHFILDTVRLMEEKLQTIRSFAPEKKVELAIDLFWAAQAYYLASSDNAIDKLLVKPLSTSQGKHILIQKALSRY